MKVRGEDGSKQQGYQTDKHGSGRKKTDSGTRSFDGLNSYRQGHKPKPTTLTTNFNTVMGTGLLGPPDFYGDTCFPCEHSPGNNLSR